MKALQHLRAFSIEQQAKRYPNVPSYALVPKKYTDKTANGLTCCIIDFLRYMGSQAERINNTGRMIDERKTVTNVIGTFKTVGSVKWVYGTGTRGTADISATINGKSVKIEVKIGRDIQSQHQKQYQRSIEQSGGLYFIAKDFQQFIDWYCLQFKITEPFKLKT